MLDSRPARRLRAVRSRACRAAPTAPSARSSPARSCTSCAAASSRRSRRIPHTPYYGAVDTTPLYLLLVCEVVMWTGDLEFFELLREPIEAALRWIDEYGDLDGDGFVEYRRRSRAGLEQPGLARRRATPSCTATAAPPRGPSPWPSRRPTSTTPSAAWRASSGSSATSSCSERLQAENAGPQAALQRALLDGGRGLRGDGPGRRQAPGARRSCSTAGHCLWSRIVAEEHVPAVVERLLAPDMFSGWGVRTMAKSARALQSR